MPQFDEREKAIINRIQSDFPIAERPYRVISEELGLTEKELIETLASLKERGFIRRIGGNFSPERVGFFSTLCAARVPEEKVDFFKDTVNAYPGVTHNYIRENAYNVWFTFISPSVEAIESNLAEISKKTGITDVLNLPATRVFKIRAQFAIK